MSDKIIIADDHPLFREGLRRIVQRVMVGVVVEVSDTKSLILEAQRQPEPILMLLDLVFPGFNGAASIRELRKAYPQTALVVVSMTDDAQVAEQMMAAGANGFISKSIPPDQMVQAISQIVEGEVVVCLDSASDEAIDALNPMDGLPQRHIDVLIRLGQGKTNKEIARELAISPFTVRAHISALFKSLGVNTRSAASALAALHGLI
ncbi:response regulator [Maritalea sp.]|uniref:response regulator n=1 Tax=Maritalea sp. TaxID=2003361 RepID=UPI003EF422CE